MTDMRVILLRSAAPEHTLSVESRKTYCGDHYCDGHNSRFFVCACGEEHYAGEVYDGGRYYGKTLEEFEFEHLAAVVREREQQKAQAKADERALKTVKPGRRQRESALADGGQPGGEG